VFWPALYFGVVGSLAGSAQQGHAWFMGFLVQQAWAWGWLAPAGIVTGLTLRIGWSRYATPRLSRLTQRALVRQPDHSLSDMRSEVGKLQTRDFAPRAHYRDGELFVGLDAENQPSYLSAKLFRETHMQVVGPTRFGKGVVLGVLLEQAIAQGHAVVYIDPKADKFLPYILAEACERAGRRFVYIDLNGADTRWAPFEGGAERDRRSRIVNCFGLNNTGDGGDFYKSKERAILDTILPASGTSIAGLRAALEQRGSDGKPLKENASRLFDGLTEFAALPSLNPKKGGGNKIGEALAAGATIYVRGSLDDPTVKRATQVFIAELIQEARRLAPQRSAHLTLAIDELKFMISQEVSDALATIAGFHVNMVLLHQSIKDLRAPEDRSLNVQALESGVLVNCQVKLMYRASDPDTAEWASALSGTKIVRVTKSQTVEHNRYGGESFKNERTLADMEVPVVTTNEMLSLSPRVGVLYVPERLAQVVFTAFVPADTQRVLYVRPKDKAAATATAASPLSNPASQGARHA
jgi:TraM recognition site of TraD and TraG